MSRSELFSGPPANKATAATLAATVTTLFWTISAHTFWNSMNAADMTLYISTSTILITAIIAFLVPESAAYTAYNQLRLAPAEGGIAATNPMPPYNATLEDQLHRMQELQNAMAKRLGVITAQGSRPSSVASRRTDSQ